MNGERLRQVKQIYEQIASLAPDQWNQNLARLCGDDNELRSEVIELLEVPTGDLEIIENQHFPRLLRPEEFQAATQPGEELGQWKVESLLGRGGMGEIYLAVRLDEHLTMRAAIKVLKRGLDTDEIIARFRHERQILADLDHPNIARLLDGGATADGRPWFAMQYVEGKTLDAYSDDLHLPIWQRLQLFLKTCEAVSYAHRNLVVHRDIKPGNILVNHFGEPILLDFGISGFLQPDNAQTRTLTMRGWMTPDYASPEQFRGQKLTTATDVWSLGVLLYELLTGHHPFRMGALSPDDLRHNICEGEAERPSSVIGREEERLDSEGRVRVINRETVARNRDCDPARLRRLLTGDLDNIVLKAIAPETSKRYASVDHLVEDLRRMLAGQPVLARTPTPLYLTGKFLRRYKFRMLAATAFMLMILGFSLFGFFQARILEEKSNQAESERDRAERMVQFVEEMFIRARPEMAQTPIQDARNVLDYGRAQLDSFAQQPETHIRMMELLGNAYMSLGHYQEAEELMNEALRQRESGEGAESPTYQSSRLNRAQLLIIRGEYEAAETLLRDCLAVRERFLPDDLSGLNDVQLALSLVLRKMGRFEEASDGYYRVLDKSGPSLKRDHQVAAMDGLGMLMWEESSFSEAEKFFNRAYRISVALWGRESLESASCLDHLAMLLMETGAYDRALFPAERSLDVRIQLLGSSHPQTSASLLNRGRLYQLQGQYTEADQLFSQAREISLVALGPNHPDYGLCLERLGENAAARGDLPTARSLLGQAIAIRLEKLGYDHPLLAVSYNLMGPVLYQMGENEAAQSLIQRAAAINTAHYGEQHPNTAYSKMLMARFKSDEGSLESADFLLQQAVSINRSMLSRHPVLAESIRNLAECRRQQGLYSEAEGLCLEALDLSRQFLDPAHPDIARNLELLAGILIDEGDREAALTHLNTALAIYQKKNSGPHPDTLRCLGQLAWLFQINGQYTQAWDIYEDLFTMQAALNLFNKDTAMIRAQFALLMNERGMPVDAEELLRTSLEDLAWVLGAEHPQMAAFRLALARMQAQNGNPTLVAQKADVPLRILKSLPDYHVLKRAALQTEAMLNFSAQNWDQARKSQDLLISLSAPDLTHPLETAGYRLEQANYLLSSDQRSQAAAMLQAVSPALISGHPRLSIMRLVIQARLTAASGDFNGALNLLNQAADQEQITDLNPLILDLNNLKARILLELGEINEVWNLVEYNRQIGGELTPDPQLRAAMMEIRGLYHYRLGHVNQAECSFREAVAMLRNMSVPNQEALFNNHAQLLGCLLDQGDLEAAEYLAGTELFQDEAHALTPNQKNRLLIAQVRLERSRGNLEKALFLLDQYPASTMQNQAFELETQDYLLELARVHKEKGRYGLAGDIYDSLLKQDRGLPSPKIAAILLERVEIQLAKQQPEEIAESLSLAEALFTSIYPAQDPAFCQIRLRQARLAHLLGQDEQAEKLFQEAADLQNQMPFQASPLQLQLWEQMGSYYFDRRDRKKAEHWFRRALTLARSELKENSPLMISLLNGLAASCSSQAESGELWSQALEMALATLGRNHPQTAVILANLGSLYNQDGREEKALDYYQMASEIFTSLDYADPHAGRLGVQLGQILVERGLYKKAENALRQALPLNEVARDSELGRPFWIRNLSLLAITLAHQGNLTAAEPMADQALGQLEILSPETPFERVRFLQNMAWVKRLANRFEEARRLLNQAIDLAAGAEDPALFQDCRRSLAQLLSIQNQNKEAATLFRTLIEEETARPTPDLARIIEDRLSLANVLIYEGQFSEAGDHYQKALAEVRRNNNPKLLADTLQEMTFLNFQENHLGLAEKHLREALDLRNQIEGNILEKSETQLRLAFVLDLRGKTGESEKLYRQCLAIRRAHLEPQHYRIAEAIAALANLLRETNRCEEAIPLYLEMIPLYQGLIELHPIHSILKTIELADLFNELGMPLEAEKVAREASDSARDLLPTDHWVIGRTETVLGCCLVALGEWREAEARLDTARRIFRKDGNDPQEEYLLASLVTSYERIGRAHKAERITGRRFH